MSVQRKPIPTFALWLPALENGILPLERLIQWADEQISRLDESPLWLLELATAKDIEGVRKAMIASLTYFDYERTYDGKIFLGCLYFAFESGQLSLANLLLRAGQFADCGGSGNGVPDCEAFYYLLNEIDGGGPTRSSSRPLNERVLELFEPMTKAVRDRFGVEKADPIEVLLPEIRD